MFSSFSSSNDFKMSAKLSLMLSIFVLLGFLSVSQSKRNRGDSGRNLNSKYYFCLWKLNPFWKFVCHQYIRNFYENFSMGACIFKKNHLMPLLMNGVIDVKLTIKIVKKFHKIFKDASQKFNDPRLGVCKQQFNFPNFKMYIKITITVTLRYLL